MSCRTSFLSSLPTLVFGRRVDKDYIVWNCPLRKLACVDTRLDFCHDAQAHKIRARHPLRLERPTLAFRPTSRAAARSRRRPQRRYKTNAMFSSASEEIHSPPVLITSLRRSVICNDPFSRIYPTSPVCRYPPSQSSSEACALSR